MTNSLNDRAEVWRQYWSRGAAHSCGGSYADGYGKAAPDFWNSVFSSLPPEAKVLDIGTGNGPLPRLLIALGTRSDLQCDAIDLADIMPPWHKTLPDCDRARVRFHSHCAAEQLPFPDHTFSAVVSQWGFEYSHLEASVPEALRVLAPGGSICLVVHHSEALPVVLAREELRHLDWLLSPDSYLSALNALLEPMSRSASAEGRAALMRDATANALRARFQSLQDEMQTRIGASHCPDILHDVMQLTGELFAVASHQGLAPARQVQTNFEEELRHAHVRLFELVTHALDAAGIAALGASLGQGAPHEVGLLEEQGQIMAWTLRVTPQAACAA